MAVSKIEVGRNVLLFQKQGVTRSKMILVISAHGAIYHQSNTMFATPYALRWYATENTCAFAGSTKTGSQLTGGKLVLPPIASTLPKGKTNSLDPALYDDRTTLDSAGTQVKEHWLSKFQGKHGNNVESYDSIKSWVEDNGEHFEVATVRNRSNPDKSVKQNGMFLSEVLNALNTKAYVYKEVRCYFCRVA